MFPVLFPRVLRLAKSVHAQTNPAARPPRRFSFFGRNPSSLHANAKDGRLTTLSRPDFHQPAVFPRSADFPAFIRWMRIKKYGRGGIGFRGMQHLAHMRAANVARLAGGGFYQLPDKR